MLMNMSMTPTTFDAWKIDCNSVQSMDNGTRYYARATHACQQCTNFLCYYVLRVEFENPTCKQLQLGNSPLTTCE